MDPLESHPEYIKAKSHLESIGLKYDWLTMVCDTENPYAQYIPAGKRGSISPCPCYEGRWRLGGFGAVKCKAAKRPIPGAYFDLICVKNHRTCPLRTKGENRNG